MSYETGARGRPAGRAGGRYGRSSSSSRAVPLACTVCPSCWRTPCHEQPHPHPPNEGPTETSYLDEEEDDLEFEDPGTERVFEVELENRMLTLRWGQSDSMTFGRRRHTTAQLTDIYGKERGSPSLKGPDIFGRERTREEEAAGGEGDDG